MKLSLIVAMSENGVIGNKNKLIWHISEDLKRFKCLTSGHHIILGRKNYDAIGYPLPNRVNIVLSRNTSLKLDSCFVVNSLEKALDICKQDDEPFVIGGADIYNLALKSGYVYKLYITRIHQKVVGDTYMPFIDYSLWKEVERLPMKRDTLLGIDYEFITYKR